MWHLGLTIWTKLALRLLDDVSDNLGRSLSDRRSFNDAKSPPGGDAFKAGRQRNCTRITWIIKQPKWSRDVDTWRWHSSCGWLKFIGPIQRQQIYDPLTHVPPTPFIQTGSLMRRRSQAILIELASAERSNETTNSLREFSYHFRLVPPSLVRWSGRLRSLPRPTMSPRRPSPTGLRPRWREFKHFNRTQLVRVYSLESLIQLTPI